MAIRLNSTDLDVINDLARFRGLSLESICQVHYDGSSYAWKRLNKLYKHNYLGRQYYYALNQTSKKIKHAQRISAIYFPKAKGLEAINYSIDPRYVIPKKDKLDVQNLLSKLFVSIPEILSKREAIQKYNMKNFMPVTSAVPTNPNPTFMSIIGCNKFRGEVSQTISFAKTKYNSCGRYIIICRTFPGKEFLLSDSYFVYWKFAPEIIPNIINCPDYYINQLQNDLKFELTGLTDSSGCFKIVRDDDGVTWHLAELFSGSSRLLLNLQTPPKNTFVYIPDKSCLRSIMLKEGHFFNVKSLKDKKSYKVYKEGDGIKTKELK